MNALAKAMLYSLLSSLLLDRSIASDVRPASPEDRLATIVTNSNRHPAGRFRGGVRTVRLEAREGVWYPESNRGPSLVVQAFGEEGRAPQIPGPLLRVPEGTDIRIIVRNRIPNATLVVHGLHSRGPAAPVTEQGIGRGDSIVVPPDSKREVRFTADVAGTYFYWATTTGATLLERSGKDSQLSGALIVDPTGESRPRTDRVFVITDWRELDSSVTPARIKRRVLVLNGKSWPHTERLTYTEGDSVRWRVINAAVSNHPMHLHGFYYRLDSRGDARRDTMYQPQGRRLAVTELMRPGSTMALTWVPERAGNWVFHCHLIAHISPTLRLASTSIPTSLTPHHGANHALDGMAGLVIGAHVRPARKSPRSDDAHTQRRTLRLLVQTAPARFDTAPGFGFVLQDGSVEPRADSVQIPGSPIVLTRGEPVHITVVNLLPEPTSVHWHGIELESFFDGIAGWSGDRRRIAPAIAPGDSFVVEYTPRRAGTFIYHSHMDEGRQLALGLYGPLIVRERGQPIDTVTDRVMLISVAGPGEGAPGLLNGRSPPAPIDLKVNVTYRLRFINITPNNVFTVRMLADSTLLSWRPFAKDGADLPDAQATPRPARQTMGVGETYDFEFTPTSPGDLRLEIRTLRTWRMEALIRVR